MRNTKVRKLQFDPKMYRDYTQVQGRSDDPNINDPIILTWMILIKKKE